MDTPLSDPDLIAPCGMNCGICKAHLRERNPCHGCSHAEQNRPKTRVNCRLRLCDKRQGRFCYSCNDFPCDRLKSLDRRYRVRYGMSEIDNLVFIRDQGLERFLEEERRKWLSESGVLCVHDRMYYRVRPG